MIESGDITATPLAINRYMPGGVVWAYSANGTADMTLGQLANSISVRLACVYESRSVSIMNRMSSSDLFIQAMSAVGEQIGGSASLGTTVDLSKFGYGSPTIKDFLINTCGVASDKLPSDIGSYSNRMTAFKLLKEKLDAATSKAQDLAVTLKTCINRRDVAYSTSSNVSKHYNATMINVANRLKR